MDSEINFIMSESKYLDRKDLIHILQMVREHGQESGIMEKPDGSRINLDSMPERLIIQIYSFMKRKTNCDD